MKVAVTGTTGRVGAALAAGLGRRHEVIGLPRGRFDLSDPVGMTAVLNGLECDVFLNPAGLTSLEACEDDPALAWRLNAEAPGKLAAWAERTGVRLVHFSTDYVFGGELPGFRSENDDTGPVSEYGRTKRAGELAVLAHSGTCVVRVSWVFGPEKPSFVDSVIHRAMAGEPIEAVADKYSLPTHTRDLCGWIDALLRTDAGGIFHACHTGDAVSWHGMAGVVVDELVKQGRLESVPEIAAGVLDKVAGFRAVRPRHTAMSVARLTDLLGESPRVWEDALREYVRECR